MLTERNQSQKTGASCPVESRSESGKMTAPSTSAQWFPEARVDSKMVDTNLHSDEELVNLHDREAYKANTHKRIKLHIQNGWILCCANHPAQQDAVQMLNG